MSRGQARFEWTMKPLAWVHPNQRGRAEACVMFLHAAGILSDVERDECLLRLRKVAALQRQESE
jgi:hypothetical protein